MAVSTQKVLASGGGHSGQVGMTINKKELNSIIKSLESLNMSDSKNKTLLRQAMRKAAKPILSELKGLVPKDSGQLRKSLSIINGKNRKGVAPSVFVGPRVKGAFANENKTGFYFYFLEYGFRGIPGGRMLDKTAQSAAGKNALQNVVKEIVKVIDKIWSKR